MSTPTNSKIAVSVSGLEKKFGNFTAVNRINFQVAQGEIFGFLGPNGAGKSTTIRMLCGIHRPTGGSGKVSGFDIMTEQAQIKQNIGYMSQKFSLYDDLTVEENIDFYSGIYRISDKKERKEEVIKKTNLENFRKRLTITLSGGWKQRLALGCALIHRPKILFLDEPTSGVDPITRESFWDIINGLAKKGVTVFVTTHYMDEAENCNRMAMIYKGNMIAMGTPKEMKTKYMQRQVLEISTKGPEAWAEKIKNIESIEDTALFGSNIHAVTKDAAQAISLIEKAFKEQGASGYKVNQIEASLEDVFVSLIENYDQTHGKADTRTVS